MPASLPGPNPLDPEADIAAHRRPEMIIVRQVAVDLKQRHQIETLICRGGRRRMTGDQPDAGGD
jgi:hypothetical protein